MVTVSDIKNVKFRKTNIGGYRAEDVDNFLDEVQDSYEKLQKENLNLTHKIKILADRVSQYRKDEDSVKTALVSAQKLASAALSEAQKEADIILETAQKEASEILKNANNEIANQKETLIGLKKAVKDFRSNILSLYKEHLKLVNSFNAEDRLPANFNNKIDKKLEDDKESDLLDSAKIENEIKISSDLLDSAKVENEIKMNSNFEKDEENEKDMTFEEVSSNKFFDLKFGEDYDVSKDTKEEPVGLFT